MVPSVHIRRATSEDRDPVGVLWLRLLEDLQSRDDRFAPAEDAEHRWRNSFEALIGSEAQRLFVAEREGIVVGFQSAERYFPPPVYAGGLEVHLNELYVVPEARRQGVATALFEAARMWAEEIGATRLRMGVLAKNEPATQFCERQGAASFVTTLTLEMPGATTEPKARRRLGFDV